MALTAPEHGPATAPDARRAAESVEYAFDAFDAAAPEGWRVELIEGEIRVVPPADGEHEEIVSEVVGQLRDHRKDLRTYTGIGLRIPDAATGSKVVPDLVVAPRGTFANENQYHPAAGALLVGEVTSRSTGATDRRNKLTVYARAAIPCYLLIDREAGSAMLFSEPEQGDCTRSAVVKISGKLELPEPFGFPLDTSEF